MCSTTFVISLVQAIIVLSPQIPLHFLADGSIAWSRSLFSRRSLVSSFSLWPHNISFLVFRLSRSLTFLRIPGTDNRHGK
ncbi:hypothetical protein BJY01DRAFT_211335 [Aspergillus pseudoustus]|uniref:Secreted protein n=1 Tax=Aspergillus pseudoustus TaxID=1810923 RepID=A0ABR4KAH3_9EURO